MITILLAAYNGEFYLADQIDSILAQTVDEWKLIIRDDGSTDRTVEIAEQYANQYPDKIFFYLCDTPSGSAQNNFFRLLSMVDTEYCMTCDQDDIWLPGKIEKTLKKMQALEIQYGIEVPLLVHTNVKVVDAQLHQINASFIDMLNLDPSRSKINQILTQNIVTGCTLMINRALLKQMQLQPYPEYTLMHDWWLALIAAAFGRIGWIAEPTVLYRQHNANQVGAKDARKFSYNWQRFCDQLASRDILRDTYRQAACFQEIYGKQLDLPIQYMIETFSKLSSYPKIKRIYCLFRYGFWKSGILRKLGQILFV